MTDNFKKDGFLVLENVLNGDLVDKFYDHFKDLVVEYKSINPDEISSHLLQKDPIWFSLISNDKLLNIATKLIGPNIAHFYSRYFAKEPFIGREVPWHQDAAYYPLEPLEFCTLWVALTDSNIHNGCLRVIPGSHKENLREIRASDNPGVILKRTMDSSDLDEDKSTNLEVKKGSIIILDPKLIHASYPNTSPEWRVGIAIRYIPTHVSIMWEKLYGVSWDCAFLLRGEATNAYINNYLPHPNM